MHGGAIPVERLGFEPGLQTRDATMADEKDRIARAALAELPAEGAILLDAEARDRCCAIAAGRHLARPKMADVRAHPVVAAVAMVLARQRAGGDDHQQARADRAA